jgi:hypothetical protein
MALSRPPASAAGPLRAAKGRIISLPSMIETVDQEFDRGKARMDVLALHGTPLFGCAPHVRARGNQTSLPGTSDVSSPDIGRSSWRGKGDPTSRGWPTHFRRPRQRGPDSIGRQQSLDASRSKSRESDFCATSRRGSYQTLFIERLCGGSADSFPQARKRPIQRLS